MKSKAGPRFAFAVAVVVVIIALAFGIDWLIRSSIKTSIPQTAPRVEFREGNTALWYAIVGEKLMKASGPQSLFSKTPLLEALPTLSNGMTPVIAQAKGQSPAVGYLDSSGSFTGILSGTSVSGVAARQDGWALATVATSSETLGELALFDLQEPQNAPAYLGQGAGSVLAGDGSGAFLFIGPAGLMSVNPPSASTTVVLNEPNPALEGAVSASGLVVALPSLQSNEVDFFSISSADPPVGSYMGFLKGTPSAIAFLNDSEFIVLASSTATVYSLSADPNQAPTAVKTYTLSP